MSDQLQTTIIDLAGSRKVDIEIPYVQPTQWANVPPWHVDSTGVLLETVAYAARLVIRPVSPLVANGSTQSVYVNCYLRADGRFKVARPNLSKLSPWTAYPSTSDTIVSYESEVVSTSKIYGEEDPHIFMTNFGEKIDSLREVVKKFSFHQSASISDLDVLADGLRVLYFPMYPASPPQNLGLLTQDFVTTLAMSHTYPSYFSLPFLAKRGGMRWKSYIPSNNDYNPIGFVGTKYTSEAFSQDNMGVLPYHDSVFSQFSDSMSLTCPSQQPFREFEVPYLGQANFVKARYNFLQGNSQKFAVGIMGYAGLTDIRADNFVAAADDYTLNQFLYVPTFYKRNVVG